MMVVAGKTRAEPWPLKVYSVYVGNYQLLVIIWPVPEYGPFRRRSSDEILCLIVNSYLSVMTERIQSCREVLYICSILGPNRIVGKYAPCVTSPSKSRIIKPIRNELKSSSNISLQKPTQNLERVLDMRSLNPSLKNSCD